MRLVLVLLILTGRFLFFPQVSLAQSEHIWKRVTQTRLQQLMDPLKIEQAQIWAIVGYSQITIEGHTSPNANVQLTNSQANLGHKQTKANKDGFFKFTNIILPVYPGELWLQATSTQGLTSPPIAIPKPPPDLEKIEDVILPPTLAHSSGIFKKGVRSLAFGQATPESIIEVYFFKDSTKSWLKKLLSALPLAPKNAQARQEDIQPTVFNKLILETDQKGYFSFELPNQKSQFFRYYVGSIFQENYSPKSNILSFRVLSFIEALYQQVTLFADKVLALVLPIFKDLLFWIFIELVILILLKMRNS